VYNKVRFEQAQTEQCKFSGQAYGTIMWLYRAGRHYDPLFSLSASTVVATLLHQTTVIQSAIAVTHKHLFEIRSRHCVV